jgi:AcrR family transcriptional regulator
MMPAQLRSQKTREAILVAAREEFADKGPAGARIDTIAARSGANKQRIYAYFSDKDGLFRAVQADALAGLIACEEAVLTRTEADPAGFPSYLRDGYLAFHHEHPAFWRLLAWANLAGIVAKNETSPRSAVLARLRSAFAKAQQLGSIPSDAAFEPWFIGLTAVIHFLFANQRTASVNLNLALDDHGTRTGLARDALAMLWRTAQPGNPA